MGRPCDGHAVIGFLDFRSLCHANLFLEKPTRAVMAALGLGRVTTLKVGLRADATGQLYGDVADLSNFC